MSNMLFLSAVVNSFDENVADPFYARYLATFNEQQRYTVATSRVKSYTLASSATATIGSFSVTADWRMIMIKVVGEVTLTSAGNDAASAPIAGVTGCYGTSLFPGWLIWSTANLTSASTITSLADGTVVEVYYGTLAADA